MILVASAAGKVGREVVKLLKNEGYEFKAASSQPERAQQDLGADTPVVLLNYDQPETFKPALEGVDRLFILHPQDKPDRLAQLKAFIDAAVEAGVKRVVVMSAIGANLQPSDPMHLLEQYVVVKGVEHTILRPNWFMQNFHTQDLMPIREKNQIIMSAGDHPLSFIDTRDIAAVAVKALLEDGHNGKVYTLTGGETFTYAEVAAKISTATGREITFVDRPYKDVLQQMSDHGVPQEFVDFMAWLYDDIHRDYTAQITTDVRDVLGRDPIRLDQYVQDHAELWKA